MEYTMRGILGILAMGIYVKDNSMANILSLKEVIDYFRMTMYIKEEHAMLVHYRKDKAYHIKECVKGLYYLNIYNSETIALVTDIGDINYSFLSTVNDNMEYFTHAEIEGEDISRDLQNITGCTSDQQIINALSNNLIIN